MVGVERFELPTSCSQSRRATRLRYTPNFKCLAPIVLKGPGMVLPRPTLVNFFRAGSLRHPLIRTLH